MRGFRILLPAAILLCCAFALAGQSILSTLEAILHLSGDPVAASSAVLSEHELEEINAMPPQDQVMRLLERTINHYAGAGEEIEKRADSWLGQVHSTPELTKLSDVAYFSSDLRVRAAALEIWRVEAGYRKAPETVEQILNAMNVEPERKYFYLSHLGILGNRGVQRQQVFDVLMRYLYDPDGNSRAAAINGLGLLGTENTIAPLLEILHSDPSHDLRERAACNLADSGMLPRELRQKAIPDLARLREDPALDDTTKKWVRQALDEIKTGDSSPSWLR